MKNLFPLFALFTCLVLLSFGATSIQPAVSLLSGDWQLRKDALLAPSRDILRGERGLAVFGEAVGDFELTLRLRIDDLRFQARLPEAGVAFSVVDAKQYGAVLIDRNSGWLQLVNVEKGLAIPLASSERGWFFEVGEWTWMRLSRSRNRLTVELSSDGHAWCRMLCADLPGNLGRGRLGVIGDIPSVSFDLTAVPPLIVRADGAYSQTSPEQVVGGALAEVFCAGETAELVLRWQGGERRYPLPAGAGVRRVPLLFAFSAAQESQALSAELLSEGRRIAYETFVLRNPAIELERKVPESPVSVAEENTRAAYKAAFRRVAEKVSPDGYTLLGKALAYDAAPDPELRAEVRRASDTLVARFRTHGEVPVGFASFYPAIRILAAAKRDGLLNSDQKASLPALAAKALDSGAYERGAMNRALGNLAAIGPALALSPGHPHQAELLRIKRLVEDDFSAVRYEPLEDSTNYQLISLLFAFCWARDDARADVFESQSFRQQFERLLSQLSPLGYIPAYGDDHMSHPGVLIGLFEAAARQWKDGRFRWAARKVFEWNFSAGRLPSHLVSEDYVGLGLAIAEVDESLAPVEPPRRSEVLKRHDGTPDKLVFSGGGAPKDAFFLFDLLNGREHGHNDALALVGATDGGEVLFDESGRYARGSAFKNLPYATARTGSFPTPPVSVEQTRRIRAGLLPEGEWLHFRFPLRHNWIWGNFAGDVGLPSLNRDQYHPDIDAAFGYDPKRQSVFLLDWRGEGRIRVEISGARLVGGNGTRELNGLSGVEAVTLGKDSIYRGKVFDESLDLGKGPFEWLEFRLKATPEPGGAAVLNSVVIGDVDGYPKRFIRDNSPAGDLSLVTFAETAWGAFAVIRQNRSVETGEPVAIERTLVFLKNRLLWVRDRFVNSGKASLAVGPLWRPRRAQWCRDGWLSIGGGVSLRCSGQGAESLCRTPIFGVTSDLVYSRELSLAPGESRLFDTVFRIGGEKGGVEIEGDSLRLASGERLTLSGGAAVFGTSKNP